MGMAGAVKIVLLWALLGNVIGRALLAEENPHLNVVVRFSAELSNELVAGAEASASRVFAKAGLALQWRNCPSRGGEFLDEACQGSAGVNDFVLQIVPHAKRATGAVFGVAFVSGSGGAYADIFFDRIQRIHDENRKISKMALLGYVMAHEIGHLLLGERSHSQTGVMLGQWHADELARIGRGALFFDPREAALLNARVVELKGAQALAVMASESGN